MTWVRGGVLICLRPGAFRQTYWSGSKPGGTQIRNELEKSGCNR